MTKHVLILIAMLMLVGCCDRTRISIVNNCESRIEFEMSYPFIGYSLCATETSSGVIVPGDAWVYGDDSFGVRDHHVSVMPINRMLVRVRQSYPSEWSYAHFAAFESDAYTILVSELPDSTAVFEIYNQENVLVPHVDDNFGWKQR